MIADLVHLPYSPRKKSAKFQKKSGSQVIKLLCGSAVSAWREPKNEAAARGQKGTSLISDAGQAGEGGVLPGSGAATGA